MLSATDLAALLAATHAGEAGASEQLRDALIDCLPEGKDGLAAEIAGRAAPGSLYVVWWYDWEGERDECQPLPGPPGKPRRALAQVLPGLEEEWRADMEEEWREDYDIVGDHRVGVTEYDRDTGGCVNYHIYDLFLYPSHTILEERI